LCFFEFDDDLLFHTTGWIKMKAKLLTLALTAAALMVPAISRAVPPAQGDTRVCRVTLSKSCPGSYPDSEGTIKSDFFLPNSTYRSVQWIGTGRPCTTSGGCTTTFSRVSTDAVTWKLGVKVSATYKVGDTIGIAGEVNAEYGKTFTDTDIITETRSIAYGYTHQPYTYISRGIVYRTYLGVWERGNGYSCGAFGAYRCYKYTWNRSAVAAETVYKVFNSGGGQLYDFAVYKNNTSSGLFLENDN
jgi:hypothetical protein